MKWNEEEFFKDFAKASDNITAEDEFVNRLRKLPESKLRPKVHYERYILAAAAVVLCISIGMFGVNRITGKGNTGNDINKNQIELASKETELGSMQTIDISSKLNKAKDYVEDTSVKITDENGNEISATTRTLLKQQLNKATLIKEDKEGDYTSYYCEGKEKIEIRVYVQSDGDIKVDVVE